jgi:hypothetical protein
LTELGVGGNLSSLEVLASVGIEAFVPLVFPLAKVMTMLNLSLYLDVIRRLAKVELL